VAGIGSEYVAAFKSVQVAGSVGIRSKPSLIAASLIFRLTPAGLENAGRIESNGDVSDDLRLESAMTVPSSQISAAPMAPGQDDGSTTAAIVEVARGHLNASQAVTRAAIVTIAARRPNSDEEIRRKAETLHRLEQVAQLLHQAQITLDDGRPPEAAALEVGRSLLVMLQDLDKLIPGAPGVKIVNTTLGIVVLCTAAVFDTLVPAPVTAGVMATGVYGSDAVRMIIGEIKGFLNKRGGAGPDREGGNGKRPV